MTLFYDWLRGATCLGLSLMLFTALPACDHGSRRGSPMTTFATTSSTTPSNVPSFEVYLGVTNNVGRLGALQFDVRFLGDTGGWVGAAGWVRCETTVEAALATFNDKGQGVLSGAMIDLNGLPTPGNMARCTFRAGEEMSPNSFEVDVVDSATTEGVPPATAPSMAVTRVESMQ